MHLPDGRTLRRVVSPHPFGGLLSMFEGVTDRLALERPCNSLTGVQRETINNLHGGVAIIGQNGRLQLCNPNLLVMWELDADFIEAEPHVNELFDANQNLVPVGEILENVRDNALKKIGRGRLKIEVYYPSGIGQARVGRTRITKGLFNPLWSSVMFQSDDKVSTHGKIAVEVGDSMGIVVKDVDSTLYDKFAHGDPFLRRSGSDLGHALAKSLVGLHCGDLNIRSDIERSTHAIALFPVKGPSSTAARIWAV